MLNEALITYQPFEREIITSLAWKGNYGVIGTMHSEDYGNLYLIKLEDHAKKFNCVWKKKCN